MRSLFLNSLIAASLLVSATPVLAAGASQPTTKLKYNAKMQKYCAIDPAVTGSHLQQQTCKTSAQWSAAGLDMPKPHIADPSIPIATVATVAPVATIAQR
ncbi:hypothetical protein QP178_18475 [Sphingomonas aurantiaca]|uniref:hypothetical protein n=1 Tax=Sphingomonas TaxID=13687 RepID=UPI0006F7B5BD|nr:hypothetical protein [Sphingomonas sp. Leaf28]KQN07767.1 hypothetical protein ASE79_17850 [Sphingomonas sp. Leaf28]